MIQSEGDNWRAFRNGPLSVYGAYGLAGIISLLIVFYLVRGRYGLMLALLMIKSTFRSNW